MATAAPDASGLGGTAMDVVVVGAGIAGLAAATTAAAAGLSVVVVEASDGVGGRMRTDAVDGFLLDRGFHVFIEAYESQRQLYVDAAATARGGWGGGERGGEQGRGRV